MHHLKSSQEEEEFARHILGVRQQEEEFMGGLEEFWDIGDLQAPQSCQSGTEEKRSHRPGSEIHSLPQLNNIFLFFSVSLSWRATAYRRRPFARGTEECVFRIPP